MQTVVRRHAALPTGRPGRFGGALALALVGMVMLGDAPLAQTETAWVASVRGVGRAPVPPGTPLAVVARDFSDVNTRLKPVLEQALADQGFAVAPDASLQLVYATQLSDAAPEAGTGYAIGDGREERVFQSDIRDTGPNPAQFDDVAPQVRIPLGRTGKGAVSQYALSVTVGAPGQTPLWTGGVTVALPPRDPLSVAEAMVPILVPQIGRNVEAVQAFPD